MSTLRELLFLKDFTHYLWDDTNLFLQASADFPDETNVPLISRYSLSPHVAYVGHTVVSLCETLGACTCCVEE